MFNPQPVFTETFALKTSGTQVTLAANAGGTLAVSMDQLPQLAQYSNLYQKYRILRAQFVCLPAYNSLANDANTYSYNASQSISAAGMSRIVFSIQDTPGTPAPANEDAVLQDNGVRIVPGGPKIVMSCRPAPDTKDANGVQLTQKNKFITFATTNIAHYGVNWWHTCSLATPNPAIPYFVYCKLTFQLADPR